MQAKKFLKRFTDLENEIALKQGIINKLEQLGTDTAQITAYKKSLNDDLIKIEDIQREIMLVIGQLSNSKLKLLVVKRYICGETWAKVADDLNYSYVHVVHRLHPKALEEIEKILESM